MADTGYVVETERLTKVYPGDVLAVDDLNLQIRAGEIFGLLGPNGAGKSTTAGMLTTRVEPTKGRALVGGIDVWGDPAQAKRLIGVVPQTNTLDRALTVWENLYFHGRFFGMSARTARSESDALLDRFRLADRAAAPVMALSGGMAQRLMAARAVMHRPRVLFLDEPTAGLDPQSRIALWEILRELHVDGQTIVLTTHYMEEADELCDRLAIIDRGRTKALDTPEGLKASVGADTFVNVTAEGDLEALGRELSGRLPDVRSSTVTADRVQLGVSRADGILPSVLAAAESAGFRVRDLSVEVPTLEDVFIQLTGRDLRD
jgi:ABC-2 type transport system ATP-binding protein